VLGLLVLLACVPALAQPAGEAAARPVLLHIVEKDLNGGSHAVPRDIAIVDIGSTLDIRVDRDALAGWVSGAGMGASTQALIDDYARLQALLVGATAEGLAPLGKSLAAWGAAGGSPAATAALQQALTAQGSAPLAVLEYAAETPPRGASPSRVRLREALNRALGEEAGQPVVRLYARILQVAQQEVEVLRGALEEALRQEGVSFQMGAWVATGEGSRPLHLPNFDTYAPQERFDIDRFSLVLTDTQRQQLRQAERLSQALNTRQLSGDLGFGGQQQLAQLFSSTRGCLDELQLRLQAFQRSGTAIPQALLSAAEETRAQMDTYGAYMNGLATKYRSPAATSSSADFLIGTYDDLNEASQRTSRLVAQLTTLSNGLRGRGTALEESGKGLLAQLDTCIRSLSGELRTAFTTVAAAVRPLAELQRANTSTLRFGQEVLRLELGALPESTSLDLADAGRRAPGDTVVLKLALRHGERPPHELETRQLQLQRVLVHLETVVGLIFAQQPRSETNPSLFQVAPAYSILFRGASRTSPFWNNVLTPGLGINVSALDFDKDSTPELGAAVTLALFRDFVQVGYGYNVFQNRGYFFFGLGLPMPSLGLPVAGGTSGSASVP
jgi:hypothetical protein